MFTFLHQNWQKVLAVGNLLISEPKKFPLTVVNLENLNIATESQFLRFCTLNELPEVEKQQIQETTTSKAVLDLPSQWKLSRFQADLSNTRTR